MTSASQDTQDIRRQCEEREELDEYRPRVKTIVSGFEPLIAKIFNHRGKARRQYRDEFDQKMCNVLQYLMDEHDMYLEEFEDRIEAVRNTAMKYSDQAFALREEKKELESRIEELEGDRDDQDRLETLVEGLVEGIEEELKEV